MKFQIIAVCIAAWYWVPHANAEPAAVDYEKSSLGFEVRSGDRSINGIFGRWSVDVAFDREDPEAASFRVVAEIDSITLSDEIAQTMVATSAWLAAEEFPIAAFESETVTLICSGSFNVTGTLVLRGVTIPVDLVVAMRNPRDTTVAEVTGEINRTDFAIGSSFGPEIVDSMVKLRATVVLSQ